MSDKNISHDLEPLEFFLSDCLTEADIIALANELWNKKCISEGNVKRFIFSEKIFIREFIYFNSTE